MKPFARLKVAKRLLFAAAVCVFSTAFAAENASRALVQYTPHDRLFAVAFSGDFGEAVGESGLVLQTSDGGKTWEHEIKAPSGLAIFNVAISGSRSIAVGQQGLILVRDGNKAWKQIPAVTEQRLLGVSLDKNGQAYAVGAFGIVLKSTDNGETWAQLKPDWATLYKTESTSDFVAARDEVTLYAVRQTADGAILITGEYGQIDRSTDGGKTWTVVYKAQATAKTGLTPPTLFGMHVRDDGTGYAAGQDGLIVMTSDGGKSWTPLQSGSEASLFDVNSTPDGHVFAVGMRSGIVSPDGGKTWLPIGALDLNLNWYSGVASSSSAAGNSMIAVGHSGRVLQLVAGSN